MVGSPENSTRLMAHPHDSGMDDFQLPELDILLMDQPPSQLLDPAALAQWMGDEGGADLTLPLPAHNNSSGGSTGTDAVKSLSKAEEKLERVRAQNRAKQARWRERQKVRGAVAGEDCTGNS